MGSNLLNCHNSGWIKGKGLTYYSYRNKSHLLIGNSIAISIKQGWTEQLQQQDHYRHSIPFTVIVLLKIFLPYPPTKNHAMASEQYHFSQRDAVRKCCCCLVFPPSPQFLYPFCLLGFFKKNITPWNPALINLITYLWLVGKNVVKVSCMYKN